MSYFAIENKGVPERRLEIIPFEPDAVSAAVGIVDISLHNIRLYTSFVFPLYFRMLEFNPHFV